MMKKIYLLFSFVLHILLLLATNNSHLDLQENILARATSGSMQKFLNVTQVSCVCCLFACAGGGDDDDVVVISGRNNKFLICF